MTDQFLLRSAVLDEEDSEMTEEMQTPSAVPQQTASKKPTFNELIAMQSTQGFWKA